MGDLVDKWEEVSGNFLVTDLRVLLDTEMKELFFLIALYEYDMWNQVRACGEDGLYHCMISLN